MTTDRRVARRKPSLLEPAQDPGNVSRACKLVGHSRQQFHELRRNHQTYGAAGLLDRAKGPRDPRPNRAAPGIEGAILAFVNAWDEFLLALSFMSSHEMRTVAVGITLYQGEYAFPWPLISAALIVALVPIAVLIVAFQEKVVSGLTQGGLKG